MLNADRYPADCIERGKNENKDQVYHIVDTDYRDPGNFHRHGDN